MNMHSMKNVAQPIKELSPKGANLIIKNCSLYYPTTVYLMWEGSNNSATSE